ncbi:MAG: hypothetical protein AB7D39_20735, partial [Pseudodesulfovibrio sp.]|uniref:hypothetical protein n=1 Tax=Pseudodesulfovibrio sp. TaxID=2035812 RepID=UPI003D1111FD
VNQVCFWLLVLHSNLLVTMAYCITNMLTSQQVIEPVQCSIDYCYQRTARFPPGTFATSKTFARR